MQPIPRIGETGLEKSEGIALHRTAVPLLFTLEEAAYLQTAFTVYCSYLLI